MGADGENKEECQEEFVDAVSKNSGQRADREISPRPGGGSRAEAAGRLDCGLRRCFSTPGHGCLIE